MIYFFKPCISNFKEEKWQIFTDSALKIIKSFKPQNTHEVEDLRVFEFNKLSEKDLIIFFNPEKIDYYLKKILEKGVEKEVKFIPIAINKELREPYEIINQINSYDITNEISKRGLNENDIKILGECFARFIITKYYPALFNKDIKVFLSYRRKDVEDEIKLFTKYLNEEIFIDINVLRAGDNAQEKIEEELKENTDILIFIQSKTTDCSHYQLVEIKKAFELSIPILWVTVGLNKGDFSKLGVWPVGNPHFELEKLDKDNINDIMDIAFKLISLKKQRELDRAISKLKIINDKAEYKELCDLDNVYQFTERIPGRYLRSTETERIDFFKCICRKYIEYDLLNLKKYIGEKSNTEGYILSNKDLNKQLEKNIYLDNYNHFLPLDRDLKINGYIIISGSFPNNIDLLYQQNIIDAIYSLCNNILDHGGGIIFGSHPTFQGLILELSKNNINYTKNKIKLYVSKYFEGNYDLDYFSKNSAVYEIEKALSGNINDSLTKMREEMINDKDAVSIICIGGKISVDSLSKKTGIDEEIEIAKKRGIRAFVLGSTGGRSSELIDEGFKNTSKEDENDYLSYENNFEDIFNCILKYIGK